MRETTMNVKRFTTGLVTGFLVGFILGLIVVSALGTRWLMSERAKLFNGAEKTSVIAAAEDLAIGTRLNMTNIGMETVFKAGVATGRTIAPEEVKTIIGRPVINNIIKGDPILRTDVK